MNIQESLPGLYRQTSKERLEQIAIPIGWIRAVESLRPFAHNLQLILGTSGTGRDSLIDEMIQLNPSLQRARRVTTRPYRNNSESTRILSVTFSEFEDNIKKNRIICPYNYPANGQWYGIQTEELQKITQGTTFLEGTPELIPLKMLLPEAKLFLVIPENLTQIREQMGIREGAFTDETVRRLRQTTRELASLTTRLPKLIRNGIVDGVIKNQPPIRLSAQKALGQITGILSSDSISEQLQSDIQQYLNEWRRT